MAKIKSALKKALSALAGGAYGFVSFWWVGISLAAICLPLEERGSLEWEEDAMFIPLGVIGAAFWLALTAYLLCKIRRSWPRLAAALFWGAALLTAAGMYIVVINRPL